MKKMLDTYWLYWKRKANNMARIKADSIEKSDEELACLMSTEVLFTSYFQEHDCIPGCECLCAFCVEYRKRMEKKNEL